MDSDYLIRWMTKECAGDSPMAQALHTVLQHAIITTPGCRLGSKPKGAKRNLSNVLANQVGEVLISLRDNPDKGNGITDEYHDPESYDADCEFFETWISGIHNDLCPGSKANDLLRAYRSLDFLLENHETIDIVQRTRSRDVCAELRLLGDALYLISDQFSKKYKSHKSSDDRGFCRYCYRNSYGESDVCTEHQGNKRPTDKRHGLVQAERYRALRKNRKLYNAIRDDARINGIEGLPFTRAVIEKHRISLVPTSEKRTAWFEQILGALEVNGQEVNGKNKFEYFVKGIPDSLLHYQLHYQPDMPITILISENLVRHEIYMLAQASTTKLLSASILNREKKGERVSISSLAAGMGITRQALHKQVKALKESNDPILYMPDRVLEIAIRTIQSF